MQEETAEAAEEGDGVEEDTDCEGGGDAGQPDLRWNPRVGFGVLIDEVARDTEKSDTKTPLYDSKEPESSLFEEHLD